MSGISIEVLRSLMYIVIGGLLLAWTGKQFLREFFERYEDSNRRLSREQSENYLNQAERYEEESKRELEKQRLIGIEKLESYYKKTYGKDFILTINTFFKLNEERIVDLAEVLQLHFQGPPATYPRAKTDEILLSLPKELDILKAMGKELIRISCMYDISIYEILRYAIERYGYSDLVTIPLYIVCSNGIQLRNETKVGEGWLEEISSSELVLSIATQKVKDNYELIAKLAREFKDRIARGKVTDKTFKELYVTYRRLESVVIMQKAQLGENYKLDKYIESTLETIKEYHKTFKDFGDGKAI